ncbi:hypothetical protein [Paraburkholderia largidicola]|uniref:hypothetical protein n=1 Tax=Paraburkholderia largidicola TaxID=3014751 RepID=UPI0015DBA6A0|nr:hypothetical protein [Paraburkholderia sp. PGU16]
MSATLGGFLLFAFCFLLFAFCFFAFAARAVFVFLPLRRHPRDVIGSLALPLCGAAPTFLCRRKEK